MARGLLQAEVSRPLKLMLFFMSQKGDRSDLYTIYYSEFPVLQKIEQIFLSCQFIS